MGAYKGLTTKDVIVSEFSAERLFSLQGDNITGSDYGIDFFVGVNSQSTVPLAESYGFIKQEYTTCVYNSIKQLYYSNYLTSSIPTSSEYLGNNVWSRYDNYNASPNLTQHYFPTGSNDYISVISIPNKLYGYNIVPTTFQFTYSGSTVTDDGEGNLFTGSQYVGNIYYAHGLVVFTTGGFQQVCKAIHTGVPETLDSNYDGEPKYDGYYYYDGGGTYIYENKLLYTTMSFTSSFTLYEHQYTCNVRQNEYNFTLNPSTISASTSGALYDFATGSYFNPYVTTVGLYDNDQNLLAVGKMSIPVKIPHNSDITFIVNFDT